MQIRGVLGLFCTVLTLQIIEIQGAESSEINRKLEASELKNGYAIRLLKPLPRRNSGCETIFRGGDVLDKCDPNYGIDPAIDGIIRNYCEWNLNSHFQKNNPSRWLESYFNPNLISITNATVGYFHQDHSRTLLHKLKNIENIVYRWVEIEFNDRITGTQLGSLKCYPSQAYEMIPNRQKLYGSYTYDYSLSELQNSQLIRSGLTIGNVLDQLAGYVELVKLN